MIPNVTVAVCTYRRPEWLKMCLDALMVQDLPREKFSILIIDNYGEQSCANLAAEYGADYVYEPTTGLSNARNRAAKETRTEWIFYLDDDAIAHSDMLSNFLTQITDTHLQVIGGRYEHFFRNPPPVWLLNYYQDSVKASQAPGLVELNEGEYLSGGIMACKTSIIIDYPFRQDLGMKKQQFGFGEENEWQDRLRKAGIPIHFCQDIAMDHPVQDHKQTVRSRIHLAYAHGQAQALIHRNTLSGLNYSLRLLIILVKTVPYDLARVLFKPGFYWQNGIVSSLGKIAFLTGKYSSQSTS